ncbi:uncharacterized protein LOC119071542 [Bradysia coprophila]|uniref:uncharacterized protein LOC119071542 n=1 Tax=Bradysia coprophila TaxID=38358 RepID=UPI00187DAC4A|nr:uncharacterized protein LOC119071542 [Bradysia coprophila]XP_037032333.1 uncharacterized protein LOC119071542 [Bradysia coprophila]
MNCVMLVIHLLLMLKWGLCEEEYLNNKNDEVKEILEFLRKGEEQIKSTGHKEIIFVLGSTGTGKSTLVHLLAGNPSFLRSIPSDEDSDDFIIEHLHEDKIGNVTFQSKTIYPDLVVDENNVPFYDCPGFSDTRTTGIEIATTYFTKRVINKADRLKIVFVVNFNSMLRGISSRKDFTEFVQYATEFLRNVRQYKMGIILVASKVPVHAGQVGGDAKLIHKIRGFLKEYRQFLVDETERIDSKSNGVILNRLDLIDIFLTNDIIVLFKRPNNAGPLHRLPEVMKNREELQNSIHNKINFAEMIADDFGYTLSDRSKLKINSIAEEINRRIADLFEKINRNVMDHYSNKYVNVNDIDNLQNELDGVITILSKISDSNSNSTMSEALASIKPLNIPNSQTILVDFHNHMDYIQFLGTVHDQPITMRTSDWTAALRSCIDYLVKERNWYTFAGTLLDRLSEYDIQSNVSMYDVGDIERWGLGSDNNNVSAASGISITATNFANFLKKVMTLDTVRDTESSKSKIDLLNSILNETIKSRPTCSCNSDKMSVKGNFVKISDLDKFEACCKQSVQSIEVFGLSTVFFDSDFKRNVHLVVIAPKWCVVRAHVHVSLDGVNGTDGVDKSIDLQTKFVDGHPGTIGENANHFFGYADKIVNVENLYISAVGGNGGLGENGSTAIDGVEISPKGGDEQKLSQYAKIVERTKESDAGFLYFNKKEWEHTTFQSNVHCPSINGIGGSGGFGGYGGSIELNGMVEIKTLTRDGHDGAYGMAGKCGKVFDKVMFYKTKSTSCLFWLLCHTTISWDTQKFSDPECLQRCRNSSLVNVRGISKPRANERPNFAFSVNQYKSFVRENLHRMPVTSRFVTNFLRSMEQNPNIRAAYNTASFIDDFYQIKKQFHRRQIDDSLVYFHQSINERILEYVSNASNKVRVNDRNILANLYTAGLSKICKLRSGTDQNLIIDIESYLDVAIEHIRLVEKSGKRVALNRFKNEYRRNLDAKISDNHNIITSNIVPAVDQLTVQMDAAIEHLLTDVIKAKSSTAVDNNRYDRMRRKLNDFIIPRKVLSFVKVVADIAGLFTGFGGAVAKTLSTINRVADAFTNHYHMPSDKLSFTPTDEFDDNRYQFEDAAQFSPVQKSKSLLTVIDEILEMVSTFSFGDLLAPINLVRDKLTGARRVDLSSTEIDLLRNDVENTVRKKALEMKTHFRNETNSMKALDKVYRKLSVLHMDVEMFRKYSSNNQKLYEIESAMRQSGNKLFDLNQLEHDLRLSIIPMVKQMRTVLNQFSDEMTDHQRPSLDALKWRIQDMLKNVRYQIQQFTSLDWKINGELLHIFEKLDGAISTLSHIFDQMQVYEDQVRLSNYIANIESADYTVDMNSSSPESDNFNRLNVIIQSNVLLTIFDNALNGFKQTVFPFADFYLRRFNLPPQLDTETSLRTLVTTATDELVNLKLTLKEYYSASINPNDNLIHTADFSSDFNSSYPFYVWHGDEHSVMMAELLSGRNVTVKVDIAKGPKLNAVKFQYLQIHLKCSNRTNQSELDKFLENFDVTIIHHGNSYYRCDDKFYLISSPAQRIEYSFAQYANGLSIRSNNVYQKMKSGNFVLSPYALLTISLSARHPEQFMNFDSDFCHSIDLELIGRGQYLNPNMDACFGLEKYYAADEVLVDDFQTVSKGDIDEINK